MTNSEYGGNPGGDEIQGSVENYLTAPYSDITKLPTLDTNIVQPFTLTLDNDQFGIPTKDDDGIDILLNRPYDVVTESNSKDLRNKISADGNLNLQMYYGATMYVSGAATSNRVTTLIENDVEYNDNAILNKPQGWRGARYGFKNIKVGDYIMGNGNRFKSWYADFQMGIYYDYGANYYAVIRTGTNQPVFTGDSPSDQALLGPYLGQAWKNESFWVSEIWGTAYQPIFYGSFNSKTVGGNIG